MFGHSMLRPLVDGDIAMPWYVNSTPGGTFFHVMQEVLKTSEKVNKLVIFCGSNDLNHGLTKGGKNFKKLLSTC